MSSNHPASIREAVVANPGFFGGTAIVSALYAFGYLAEQSYLRTIHVPFASPTPTQYLTRGALFLLDSGVDLFLVPIVVALSFVGAREGAEWAVGKTCGKVKHDPLRIILLAVLVLSLFLLFTATLRMKMGWSLFLFNASLLGGLFGAARWVLFKSREPISGTVVFCLLLLGFAFLYVYLLTWDRMRLGLAGKWTVFRGVFDLFDSRILLVDKAEMRTAIESQGQWRSYYLFFEGLSICLLLLIRDLWKYLRPTEDPQETRWLRSSMLTSFARAALILYSALVVVMMTLKYGYLGRSYEYPFVRVQSPVIIPALTSSAYPDTASAFFVIGSTEKDLVLFFPPVEQETPVGVLLVVPQGSLGPIRITQQKNLFAKELWGL